MEGSEDVLSEFRNIRVVVSEGVVVWYDQTPVSLQCVRRGAARFEDDRSSSEIELDFVGDGRDRGHTIHGSHESHGVSALLNRRAEVNDWDTVSQVLGHHVLKLLGSLHDLILARCFLMAAFTAGSSASLSMSKLFDQLG